MENTFKIPKNCQTCPFLFVGTCGNCIEMQERKEVEEFGTPFDEPKAFNPNLIPKSYDYQEGN